jgi:alpha-tubulin suppressor-like RCC1 family protein
VSETPAPPAAGRAAAALVAALVAGAAVLGLAWDRNDTVSVVPAAAAGPPAQLVAAGTTHSCAVTADDGVRCWGANADFQLGNGIRTWSRVPVDAIGLDSGVAAVAVGGSHSCALTTRGTVSCWGQDPAVLSFPPATQGSARPVPVQGLTGTAVALAAGNGHTCALLRAGAAAAEETQVACWGVFTRSDASRTVVKTPAAVPGLGAGVRSLDVGFDEQCALTGDRAVRCWGAAYETSAEADPLAVVEVLPPGTGATSVAVGGRQACVVTAAGGVRCWTHGTDPEPADVAGAEDVAAVSVGDAHACGLTRTGGVLCWGVNSRGQLGNGTTADSPAAVRVAGLRGGVASVSAGLQHSCAVLRDGKAYCWGHNYEGQLGNGPSTIGFSPTPLAVARAVRPTAPPAYTVPGAAPTPTP